MIEYLIKYFILNNKKFKADKYINNGILFLLIGSLITSSQLIKILHKLIPFLIFSSGIALLIAGVISTIIGLVGIFIKKN